MTVELLFKVTGANGASFHGGSGKWDLPKDGKPGRWRSVKGDLVPCENGLHLCRPQDLLNWLGPEIYVAEAQGERVEVNGDEGKVVVRKARLVRRLDTWNERTARLFAADCAERVLPLYERGAPNDPRPRNAIAVARRYANDEATAEVLAAAWAAAWAAARAAARGAAWAAERAWQTQRLLGLLGVQP